MLDVEKLYHAVCGLLEDAGHTVYRQEVPKDFVRPSVLAAVSSHSRRHVTKKLQEHTVYITLAGYIPLDAYRRPDTAARIRLMGALMDLFDVGRIPVEDRFVWVEASSGGFEEDCCYVDLTFRYWEDIRQETEPEWIQHMNVEVESVGY